MDFLSKLFDASDFPARWVCGAGWQESPWLGWLHILSDLGIWSAYLAIPCVLAFFAFRRKDLPFRSIFLLFVAFILACGTTHLMEALIFWWPAYRLAGLLKLATAIISWATVIALVPIVPQVLRLRNPHELEREIAARIQAQSDLNRINEELARQVESLKSSEERFRLLVEGTKDHAIFLLDPNGHVATWNLGAERIKGYRAEEIIGQHFSRFYSSPDVDAGKPEHELRTATIEGRAEDEGWRVRKDGTQFWASVIITPLRDADGNLRGFSKVTRDITERRHAEENVRRLLREEEARRAAEGFAEVIREQAEMLRVTLASIGDGVIATDAQKRVTFVNPVAQTLTGWTEDEAKGKTLDDVFKIVDEKTRKAAVNPVARALQEGHVISPTNATILIAKDGTERPLDDSAAPIRDDIGNVAGAVLTFRDVTQRRQGDAAIAERVRLSALSAEVGTALTQGDTIRETLQRCTEAVVKNLNGEIGGIWTFNAAENVLELQATQGSRRTVLARMTGSR